MKNVLISTFLLVVLAVGACTKYNSTTFEPRVNLMNLNHSAADNLITQAGNRIAEDTPIVVATVSNVNALETSSALGRNISDQVMTRFVEQGFDNVSEIRLRRSLYLREKNQGASGEFLLSRDARAIAETRQAGAAVTGTYTAGFDEVLVSLRLIEVVSGKVISSTDYKIPMNSNIERLLEDGSGIGDDGAFFTSTNNSFSDF